MINKSQAFPYSKKEKWSKEDTWGLLQAQAMGNLWTACQPVALYTSSLLGLLWTTACPDGLDTWKSSSGPNQGFLVAQSPLIPYNISNKLLFY